MKIIISCPILNIAKQCAINLWKLSLTLIEILPYLYAFLNFRAFVNLYFHQEGRNSKMSFMVTILSPTSSRLTPLLGFIFTDKVITMMHCRNRTMYTRKIVYSRNN